MLGPEIQIQPSNQSTQVKYEFSCKYIGDFPCEYADYFIIEGPTIGVVITAEYPQNFKFTGLTEPVHVNRWEYGRLFLSSENIVVQWNKISC